METAVDGHLITETYTLKSKFLQRQVALTFFLPKNVAVPANMGLLLINDGQDMPVMQFDNILEQLYANKEIRPVLCVAIGAGERMQEYGVAIKTDYLGRGAKAKSYTKFVLEELLPFIKNKYNVPVFKDQAIAGFSLGGLSALDITWNHPKIFSRVGVFSGSLWWRSKDQFSYGYNDNRHRIMHRQIQKSNHKTGLKFFFQCGCLDETSDRNNNGIIDSIDDTQDLILELIKKGYGPEDITYLELDEGRHDVPTWGKAMPVFLKWGWGRKN